jgi:AcrR family transcriptional regulator
MTNAQERKAQERQARRRRIQEAARTVFTEKGYAGASIELIARAAQLSVGAIYLYFRSKEDLYTSLVEDTLVHHEAGDLPRLAVQDQAAHRPHSLSLAVDDASSKRYVHGDLLGARLSRRTSTPSGARNSLRLSRRFTCKKASGSSIR